MAMRTLICVLTLLLSACTPPPPSQADVEKFVRQYINEADVSKLAMFVSQEPIVSSISYGRIYQGWQTIRALNEEIAASPNHGKVVVGTMDVVPLGSDTALAIAPFKLSPGVFIGRNFAMEPPGAMTVVVKRTPEGLRVIHEHYSLRPI